MKVLYRQSANNKSGAGALSFCGVKNCYFKAIKQISGDGDGTKKRHSHTGFEFHVMLSGSQLYETEGGRFLLDGGKILAVPNGVPHSLLSASYPIEKYAFTFSMEDGYFESAELNDCILFPISPRVRSNIQAMTGLYQGLADKKFLMENCVLETVLLLLREIGVVAMWKSLCDDSEAENNRDERVELARQFIADNVEEPIQSGEVAAYCYISEKHLNRLFLSELGVSVAAYIKRERVRRIEELLSGTRISLSQISEQMGFPNEHGFNVFFKKHNGMPPGEYRKMTQNGKE